MGSVGTLVIVRVFARRPEGCCFAFLDERGFGDLLVLVSACAGESPRAHVAAGVKIVFRFCQTGESPVEQL
jgi:hypothetical protein